MNVTRIKALIRNLSKEANIRRFESDRPLKQRLVRLPASFVF